MARVIVCPGQGCGHHNPISDGSFPNTCAKCQASLLGQIPVDPEDVGVQGSSNSAERSGQACPRCRGRNPKDAGVCVFCGAPMSAGMSREPAAPQSPLPVDLARRFDVVEVLPAHSAEADLFVVQPRVGGPTKFLKLYRQGLNPDREVLRRLQAASADHVVRIDEFGEVATGGGMRFFEVQELLPLGSLRAELSQRGKWLPQRVEDLVREMVEALGHLEVSGLRHGDVKPENIMFRAKAPMDLVLTDFGGVQITHASVHVGQLGVFSIDYVAPEAAVGSKDDGRTLHRKSDYFSLGVIVAECLLGRHPVRLESAHARSAVLVKSGAPTDELPERFALLVQGLTAVDPAVRFGKQEVDRWLARDPTLLAPKIVEPQSDGKPYIFNKKPYYNLDALADGMHDAPAVGALWIEGGYLARGLSDHFKDHDRAFTVENIAREHGSGPVVLMYCLQVLSPRDYPRLLGVELTHENLAVASAQAVKGDEAAKRLVDLLWNEQILARFPERAEPGIKNPDAYRSIDAAWRKHVADFESTAADLNKHVNAEDRLSAQAPRELRYHALAWAASAQHCTQAAADLTAQLEESRWPAWFANAVSASATRPGALLALSMFTAALGRTASYTNNQRPLQTSPGLQSSIETSALQIQTKRRNPEACMPSLGATIIRAVHKATKAFSIPVWGFSAVLIASMCCMMIRNEVTAAMKGPDVGLEIFIYVLIALGMHLLSIPAIIYFVLVGTLIPGSVQGDALLSENTALLPHLFFWLAACAIVGIPWLFKE